MRWSTAALWSLLFNASFIIFTYATESESASIGIPTALSSSTSPESSKPTFTRISTDTQDERTSSSDSRCDSHERREWRSLASHERNEYLKAVQCIQHHKATAGIPEARTRFDDFQGHHISVTTRVHEVGQFLPWHRWFLHAFEVALREECNFSGSLPYVNLDFPNVNISIDTNRQVLGLDERRGSKQSSQVRSTLLTSRKFSEHNRFTSSPVFDALEGFGNLPLVQGPLSSGAFAKYRLIFGTGPPPNVTDHLIERGFDVTMLPHLTEHAS
ncbi:hypothetical protein H0H93_010115 [Arthromyces matolae]|nr:hypothetical protein H0H93_010115 [Arthromyces matolae]